MVYEPQGDRPAHDALVSIEMIRQAVQKQKSSGLEDLLESGLDSKSVVNPLDTEPILRDFLEDEILKICGRMGLCGAPTSTIRGVHRDIQNLLEITVGLLGTGYGELLSDFLPGEDGKVRPYPARRSEDHEPKRGGGSPS